MERDKKNFIISEKAWNTMQQYAGIAYNEDKNEISGIILVKRTEHPVSKERVWELFEPCILKQENSGHNTELDKDALSEYYMKSVKKHGPDVRYCWWHSHHTMGAFWSTTDDNEINAWENDSWSLALVVNLYGEYKLRVSVWNPIESAEDVPLEIIRAIPAATKTMLKEYKELCSERTVTSYSNASQVSMWNKSFKPSKAIDLTKEDPLTSKKRLNWFSNDNPEPYAELHDAVECEIDDMVSKFCKGELPYEMYSKQVDVLNKMLKERNAQFTIIKLKKKTSLHDAMLKNPDDHFKYKDNKAKEVYTMVNNMMFYGGQDHGWY